jgi:hypothetical protein
MADGIGSSSRLIEALRQAHEVLDSVGVGHALLGGMAANLYRRQARATQDVDFAVAANAAETLAVVEAFRRAGWQPEVRSNKTEGLRLLHADLPRIDILVADTDFERAAIARAARLTVDDVELLIVTPEDLIVYKLIAGRARDYEAVAAMIDALKTIDEGYVTGWLEQFGFADRWTRAKEEAARLDDE